MHTERGVHAYLYLLGSMFSTVSHTLPCHRFGGANIRKQACMARICTWSEDKRGEADEDEDVQPKYTEQVEIVGKTIESPRHPLRQVINAMMG